jgi:hypothetical protein
MQKSPPVKFYAAWKYLLGFVNVRRFTELIVFDSFQIVSENHSNVKPYQIYIFSPVLRVQDLLW